MLARLVSLLLTAASISMGAWRIHDIDSSRTGGADGVRVGDINGDGLQDIATGWEADGTVGVYLNPGHGSANRPWPSVRLGNGQTASAEDAMFFDIDRDGVHDLVVSCEGANKSVYGLIAPSRTNLLLSGSWSVFRFPAAGYQWMFASHADLDSDGTDDIIVGSKGRPATAPGLGWLRRTAGNPAQPSGWEYFDIAPVSWTMEVIPMDLDSDGDIDILFSEPIAIRWVENPGTTAVTKLWLRHDLLVMTDAAEATQRVKFITTRDMDNDGRIDIVYPLGWLENTTSSGGPVTFRNHSIAPPPQTGYYKSVAAADLGRRGRIDIVVGTEAYQASGDPLYPGGVVGMFSLSYGSTVFDTEWKLDTIEPLCSKGYKFDRLELLDLDGDGDLDIVTTNERRSNGGQVIWYENPRNSLPSGTRFLPRAVTPGVIAAQTAPVDLRGCSLTLPGARKTPMLVHGKAAK